MPVILGNFSRVQMTASPALADAMVGPETTLQYAQALVWQRSTRKVGKTLWDTQHQALSLREQFTEIGRLEGGTP